MDLHLYHCVFGSIRMNKHSQQSNSHPHLKHKTIQSYVIGFILSLIFTAIPYYLVVNQYLMGRQLLLAILGFGVLQMLVQIIFFLHLGRGPKPFYNVVFFIATVGIIMVVVAGSIVIINNLHYNMMPSDQTKKLVNDEAIYQVSGTKTGACQGQHPNHNVAIKNGQFDPNRTLANQCDTLSFINTDKVTHKIEFGPQGHNQPYAGMTEIVLRKGLSKTITLSDSGSFSFYDKGSIFGGSTFTVVP